MFLVSHAASINAIAIKAAIVRKRSNILTVKVPRDDADARVERICPRRSLSALQTVLDHCGAAL
jgi:hypothetical protein